MVTKDHSGNGKKDEYKDKKPCAHLATACGQHGDPKDLRDGGYIDLS
jgi:hypothetical protein